MITGGIAIFSSATVLTVFAFGFADMLLYLAASRIGEAIQFTAMKYSHTRSVP
jgi:hypothetical protein